MRKMKLGESYLNELNDVQRQAVTHLDGPVMVIAGPGSGKTRVLTYRIAHLLRSGVPPYQILALTFTNKAAREMKERIEKVAGPDAHKVWAGTFHSIFARILRVEAHRIGFPNDFSAKNYPAKRVRLICHFASVRATKCGTLRPCGRFV